MLVRFVHLIMCPMTTRCQPPPADDVETHWHEVADLCLLTLSLGRPEPLATVMLQTAATHRAMAVGSQRRRAMVGA